MNSQGSVSVYNYIIFNQEYMFPDIKKEKNIFNHQQEGERERQQQLTMRRRFNNGFQSRLP